MTYVQNADQSFPDVNIRYVVFPTVSLPTGLVPLGFNHDDIVKMINQGETDAERVLKAGPEKSKKISLEFFEKMKRSGSSNGLE